MRGSLLEVDEDVDDAEDIGEEESDDWTGDGEFEEIDFLEEEILDKRNFSRVI